MTTAILGGSFDPVHLGHLSLAREVRELGYERILFIPAARPPHKTISGGAGDEDRRAMLHLAVDELPWAGVWDGELRRGGTSYTVETVKQLQAEGRVTGRIGLVIGDDLIEGFSSWMRVDELVRNVRIILARRNEDARASFPYECDRLDNEIWPYSSTDVRRAIADGGPWDGMVPSRVAEYIRSRGLYRDDGRG